jgi:glycerol-3-phosphate acyltransferase PlsY
MLVAIGLFTASYLLGAIPFGYLIGRLRGVDLFKEGSGNIGATNAARVLGRTWGGLVFLLDLAKGAVPVAAIVPLANVIAPEAESVFGAQDVLRVGAAAFAFLGHIFPIYLGFRGGKGVATGAGTIFVLVPGPAALAVLFWIVVLFASRTVSLASIAAVGALIGARLLATPQAFATDNLPVTLYVLLGSAFVVVKHRSNIGRLARGTENRIMAESDRRQNVLRTIHVLALGMWIGGAAFFNFFAAPAIFASFKDVVHAGKSDRTADVTIIAADASQKEKDNLANALAGSAVGPVFPRYFGMQAICGFAALATALAWWKVSDERRVHRRRVLVIGLALVTVAIGWPLSNYVSELRPLRFSANAEIAEAAARDFGSWHLVSLFLSFVTVGLAGIGLAMAARLPVVKNGEAPPVP